MFEKAKWITGNPWLEWRYPEKAEDFPPSPYLAKSFVLKETPKSAVLNIVGLGQAAYYVNGKRIPDSYLPTQPSDFLQAVIYNTYEIAPLLKQGKNRLGVVLGNNGFNDLGVSSWRSTTKMLAQLDVIYPDSTTETVVSNGTWRTKPSPTLFSMRKCGDKYDARLAVSDWCDSDFDDQDWHEATVCQGPGGIYRRSSCPPVRVIKEIEGKEIAPGVFDFGEITCGWVRITVSGQRGRELVVKYAERLSEDQLHIDQKGIITAYESMAHKDRYIMAGDGTEVWEQLFSYHGFRYVEIEGEYLSVLAKAVVAYTDIKTVSEFSTDNHIINAIHSSCVNSILTNCHGALTDCPTREQNEWTGDGMLSAESTSINFDAYGMFYEWMKKFQEDQLPNGALPCIIPIKQGIWENNFANGTDWDSAIYHIPYYAFKYTGNPDIVNLMWDNMQRNLDYFATRSDTHLMSNGVGDWCGLQPMCNKEITDTAYYRINALMMSEMAEVTGRSSSSLKQLANDIKDDFRQKYVLSGKITERNETALAVSLYAGMLEPDEAAAESNALADIIARNGYRFLCGIHGLRMIFDVLSEYGHLQTVFDTIVNDKYPGYAYCIKKGLNTLPERFDFEKFEGGTDSLNHHFRSPVDSWFYKWIAGIRLNGFGYDNVIINPGFVRGISQLRAKMHGIEVLYDTHHVAITSPYSFTLMLDGKTEQYPAGQYQFEHHQMDKMGLTN